MSVVNVEQEAAWDGHEGEVWTAQADHYDRAAGRVRPVFLDALGIGPTDHVLDVGCGTGGLTRAAARLAARGQVMGVDLSTAMLDLARKRSADEGLSNVSFVRGDAQVFPFEAGAFDLAMSGFGAMFFNDPVAGFSNIGSGLRPGARLGLLAWRAVQDNAWLMALRDALAVGRELPLPPPEAPTPFSLADPDRVRRILAASGFVDVELQPVDEKIDLGADAQDALAFVKAMGIVEGLTQDLDPDSRETAMANVATLVQEHETPDGVLLESAVWVIQARKP